MSGLTTRYCHRAGRLIRIDASRITQTANQMDGLRVQIYQLPELFLPSLGLSKFPFHFRHNCHEYMTNITGGIYLKSFFLQMPHGRLLLKNRNMIDRECLSLKNSRCFVLSLKNLLFICHCGCVQFELKQIS